MSEEKKPVGTAETVQPPNAAQTAADQAGAAQSAAGVPGATEQAAGAQKAAAEEKKPLSDAKKNALLRYMAVLFAAAFLFVLVSLIMQQSSSRAQIGALNESNASALSRAEQLQTQNRDLQQEVERLKQQAAEQEKKRAEMDIRDEIADVSTQLTEKLLVGEITAEDHRALIDDFLKDLGEDDDADR